MDAPTTHTSPLPSPFMTMDSRPFLRRTAGIGSSIEPGPADLDGRRRFLGRAALALAGAGLANLAGAASMPPAGTSGAPSADPHPFGPLKQIDAGVLNVGYADLGPSQGPAVLLLHGWPYDIHAFADVAPRLAAQGYRVIVPFLRGYGTTRFLSADTPRNAQQSVFALDAIALLDALHVDQAVIGAFDWGARTADIMAAIWPQRCKALVSVSGYLIGSQQANRMPLPPELELQWWYQFYFATERGQAGYEKYRRDFNRLIWRLASPKWQFDEATYARSAAAFDNPDHVSIAVHNYRWRLGLAQGDPRLDDLERRLATAPPISVPTITMEGDANGAPHLDPAAYAARFTGPYQHRLVDGGIGHNLPQEAPAAFARAIVDADRMQGTRP